MSHRQMNHVTIEDVEDEDNIQQQQQQQNSATADIDLDRLASENQAQSISNGFDAHEVEDHQDWGEVDALEEQARREKLRDQNTAKKLANETAHMVEETS